MKFNIKLISFTVLCIILLTTSFVYAQEETRRPKSTAFTIPISVVKGIWGSVIKKGNFMIGGGGTGTVANEDVIGNGLGLGAYVQYKTSPDWISEIWEDSVFSDLALKSSVGRVYCDYSLLGIEGSLLFYSRTPEVQVYLGGGFGYQFVDRRSSVYLEEASNPLYSSMGIDFGESIDDGLSAQVQLGLDIAVRPDTSLNLEIKYVLFTSKFSASAWDLDTGWHHSESGTIGFKFLTFSAGLVFG